MLFIEKILRAVPYLRRPYFQKDTALIALETLKAELADAKAYRNVSPSSTVRQLFDGQHWFLLANEDIRQDESIGDFRSYIAKMVGKNQPSLEIGPAFNPILPKSAGYAVTIIDHTDQSGLVEKYAVYAVDVTKIEPVDLVWTGNSMAEAAGGRKFDAIVASHVIEHAPDLIQFLNECSEILNESGSIYLLIPDKRYSFDFFQPLSDVAKILSDHRIKRRRHSFESFYRHISVGLCNGERIAWDQSGITQLRFAHGDPDHSRRSAEESERAASYQDEHENYFTPVSFAIIVDELRYLREIDLKLAILTRSRGCEFLAVLRKADSSDNMPSDEYLRRKMDAHRLLLLEELERINSASTVLET